MSPPSSPTARGPATLADLARAPGKAELIGGRIEPMSPTGHLPNQVAAEIFVSLYQYVKATGKGSAYTDNMGFAVRALASTRQTFSPDAAYYDGPLPSNRNRFVEGPPTLAVEVRSEGDYGPAAEARMAAKRADYFEAGTLVVWDVDPEAAVVRIYRPEEPDRPTLRGVGQVADAGPAVPGWRLAVDQIFLR